MATGDSSEIGRGTDETFDNLCSNCIGKNKNTEAQTFCTDCQEYYCSVCINLHNDFIAFKNHQILDKARPQAGSSVQFPMVPTEKCSVHGHKLVDMYCRQHDAVGCSTCMVMQHSTCKDKEYVPDYIKRVKVESSSIVMEQLSIIASSLGTLQETFLKEKTNLLSRKDESLQQIRKFRLEINKQLDELEKNTVEDLNGIFQSVNDKIDDTLKDLQDKITELQSAQENLTSADKNVAQMFVSVRIANNVVTNANKTVTKAQHRTYSTDISFVSHQKIQSLFNQAETLGSISVTGPRSRLRHPGPLTSGETTQINTMCHKSQSNLSVMQIRNSRKYTVKEKSDTNMECHRSIKSICELDDGSIILSDYIQRKLKRLDSYSFMVRDSCIVPEWPRQVCTISSQEIAVCCIWEQLIQFVSIGLTMKPTRQIRTGFDCVGLAYNNETLFISDDVSSVYVYSMTGERLQQYNKRWFVYRLFADNYYTSIAVSSDGSTLYIAHPKKGLIIQDRYGKLIGEFTDSKLISARSVCLYKNHSVLVGGENSKNVLQFTRDGKLIGEVLKRKKGCYALCYCKKTSKLIVGMGDEIEVYDIIE